MMKRILPILSLLALPACAAAPSTAPVAPPPVTAMATVPAPAPEPPPPPKPAPASAEERVQWFKDCWSAFNAKDWAKLGGCYSETVHAESVDSGMPQTIGRTDVIEKSAKPFAAQFPDVAGESQLLLLNGDHIASVWLLKGKNSGALMGPDGSSLPATNKSFGMLSAHVVDLSEDGRSIAMERFYSDSGTMLGQLGLSKAPHRAVLAKGAEAKLVIAKNSPTEKFNLDVAKNALEAFNKHDVNALVDMMTADVVFSDLGAPKDVVGKPAVKKSFEGMFKAFSDLKIEAKTVWAAGDYIVMEGSMSGTNDGNMPSMKLKKTGKTLQVRFLEIDEVKDGKLKNMWVFDNSMAFAAQLGLLPQPAKKSENKPAEKVKNDSAHKQPAKAAEPAKAAAEKPKAGHGAASDHSEHPSK